MNGLDILSIIANLAGILTFTVALGASLFACLALTSNALREIDRLQQEWNNAGKEIYLLLQYWHSEKTRGNSELERYLRDMQGSMDALAETALAIYRELEGLKGGKGEEEGLSGWWAEARRRVLWVWRRSDVMEKMAEFSRRRQGLIHMQLGLLLRKSISQESESRIHKDLLTSLSASHGAGAKRRQQSTTLFSEGEVDVGSLKVVSE